ncbi:MAG TPA: putative toxin-antitoxin system toxin component, PIN family [Syntrophus sp. (in: bacteria)]|nr:putative toxin-antitoxin system toxin component, PIN family [Syntrophus sp. (in: bacteria)]
MNIVIDTNVLVAGLLSPFGACGEIVRMVSAGEITLSFDARILSEYNEVLRRPRFGFEEERIAALLDYLVCRGRAVAPAPLPHSLPDSDDEPFLEVALASQASCLVTGNQKHFPKEQCRGAKIISPNEFLVFYRNQQGKKTRITKRSTRTGKKRRAGR